MNTELVDQLIHARFPKKEICKRANISFTDLQIYIRNNNIIMPRLGNRRFYSDDSFFENINSEEKAYWLGFLYADGSISSQKYAYSICLSLALKDIDHIKLFKKSIKSEKKIFLTKVNYTYKKNSRTKVSAGIRLSSKKIWLDLKRLGCTTQKTLSLKFPKETMVPRHFMRHFVRGYFDGDGCIFRSKHSYEKRIEFVSSDAFILSLKDYLIGSGISKCYVRPHHASTGISYLRIDRSDDILKVYNLMYSECTFFLKRKKDIADNMYNEIFFKPENIMRRFLQSKSGQLISSRDVQKELNYNVHSAGAALRLASKNGLISFAEKRKITINGNQSSWVNFYLCL